MARNHGYMVFDTLYAHDAAFRARPQMAAGHTVAADGRTGTIRLRDGLRFHDGAPVLARDCVASIRRWAARDGFGADPDGGDGRVVRPGRPHDPLPAEGAVPPLPEALGKLSSPVPFMMPERLAQTDPSSRSREVRRLRPVPLPAGRVDAGQPRRLRHASTATRRVTRRRTGPPVARSVHVDRVEWNTIPDASTAIAALQTGQMDWLEAPSPDLLPLLARQADVTVSTLDPLGTYVLMRFNSLVPPFDDPAVRRAVLLAVNQDDYMQAMVGDPSRYRECKAFFPCGTPLSTGAGSDAMGGRLDAARAALKASAYDGAKVVVLSPSDQPLLAPLGPVTADLLGRIGMNVDLVVTDWGTLLARRASQKPASEGGWNIFHTTAVAAEFMSPASHLGLRGNGRAGWAGWFTDPALERLRTEWFAAGDGAAEQRLAAAMEREAFDAVPYVPLGQFQQPTAFRKTVTGLVAASAPFFWGLRKA